MKKHSLNTAQTHHNSGEDGQAQAILFVSMASASERTENGEPLAIHDQRTLGYRKVGTLSARVVQEFVEIGVSALDHRQRPVLLAMLTYLQEHPDIGYAIFPGPHRFSRSHTDFATLQQRFTELDVTLVYATGEVIIGENETDVFVAQLIAAAQSI